jgi:hypothetical protein
MIDVAHQPTATGQKHPPSPQPASPSLPETLISKHLNTPRNGDILPANNGLKHASPTDFIPALARSCALGGGLSEAAPRFSLCTNLTAPLPAFQRG